MEPLSPEFFGKLSRIDESHLKDFFKVGRLEEGIIKVEHLTHLPGSHIATNIQEALKQPGRLLFKLTEDEDRKGHWVAKFDANWLKGKEISEIRLEDNSTLEDVEKIGGLAKEILSFEPEIATTDPEDEIGEHDDVAAEEDAEDPDKAERGGHEHVAADDEVNAMVQEALEKKQSEADRIAEERQKSDNAAADAEKTSDDEARRREEGIEADRLSEKHDAERENRFDENLEGKEEKLDKDQEELNIAPDPPYGYSDTKDDK